MAPNFGWPFVLVMTALGSAALLSGFWFPALVIALGLAAFLFRPPSDPPVYKPQKEENAN